MNLQISEEQEILRKSFAELFANESSCERVRAAEPGGFDPELWRHLVETGVIGMRVGEEQGGGGASTLDAAVLAEEAGRRLASGPLLEAIVAARLLAGAEDRATDWLERAVEGTAVVTFAPRAPEAGEPALVPGGAVADACVGLDGDDLVLVAGGEAARHEVGGNLVSGPLAGWDLSRAPAGGERRVLASGAAARDAFGAGLEEWKLLTAAALAGLGREALELAAGYATERVQFDRPIGAFQGIAHPLANAAADVDGARLLVWRAISAIARGEQRAAALVSMAFCWAGAAAANAAEKALHTQGGNGLSLENDIQLYYRRGLGWGLLAGDPVEEHGRIADRLWGGGEPVALPDVGPCAIAFEVPDASLAFGEEARRFFRENLDDELRAHAHFAWEGHHTGFQRKLAEAGLLFPSWPKEYGGQERGPYDMAALHDVYNEFGWGLAAVETTSLVAQTLMRFGSEEIKREVLPRITRGDAVTSLGYSEPGSGSDVANAQTRAVRDGDDWVINGQKMWTSGANLSQYVFLLTRTDPEAPKHKGLTMFLVPMDTPGIEVQGIETVSDERTNATYYTDVRISDAWRVGEVNQGWGVVAYALDLEHSGGGYYGHRQLLEHCVEWARGARRRGRPAIEDPRVRDRLARVAIHAEISEVLGKRVIWSRAEGAPAPAAGPKAKVFSCEHYMGDSMDMTALMAPDSLLTGPSGSGHPEFCFRHAAAMAIYGGTTEIMRSIVAQVDLAMPRSRS